MYFRAARYGLNLRWMGRSGRLEIDPFFYILPIR